MATSRRLLAYLESRKNLTGSVLALGGVVLALTGAAGPWWPAVIPALYAAGALLVPPDRPRAPRPASPAPPPAPAAGGGVGVGESNGDSGGEQEHAERIAAIRTDLGRLRAYLDEGRAQNRFPESAQSRLDRLMERLDTLLDEKWAARVLVTAPDRVGDLARLTGHDIQEAIDTYLRTRWWDRVRPGDDAPEHHLGLQLDILLKDADSLTESLRALEFRRQRELTRDLEDRHDHRDRSSG